VANTNAQNITRVTSIVANSNGAVLGCLENSFKFECIKFTLTYLTDGVYSLIVHADKKST
jgi:hypothetical protein